MSESPGTRRRFHPLLELTLARIREFVREPEAVFWVFVFPVLLALALGIAFRNRPPELLRVAVRSDLRGAEMIVRQLSKSPDLEPVLLTPEDASRYLRTDKAQLVIGPDEDPSREPGANLAPFSFHYDPTRPQSRLARLAVDQALQRGMGRADVVEIRERTVSEPGARYIDFLIPGLIGLNLMASGMWGVGFNVVDARTKKLLKLFMATPMRRSHFLLSFMLSRLIFLFLEIAALLGFGRLVFEVTIHGSVIAVLAISLTGAMTFAGMGLLVASRANSIEAVSGWMNFAMLPMWLLSGSFFSYARFPEFMHPFIRLLPLTALNDALRAVINDGSSFMSNWSELGVLLLWGLVSFAVALKIFRWQ